MKKMDPTEKNGLGDPIPSSNQNVNDDPTLRRAGGQIVDNDEDTMTVEKEAMFPSKTCGFLKSTPTSIEKLSQKEGCTLRVGELGVSLL